MFFTMMMAAAIVLLAGCHEGNRKRHPSQKKNEANIFAFIDTSKMDEEFYKRMREFEALHPDVPLDR